MLQRAELSARTNGRLGSFNLLVWVQIVLYFFLNFLQPFSLLKEILFVLEASGKFRKYNVCFALHNFEKETALLLLSVERML